MTIDYKALIQSCEEALRAGQSQTVVQSLGALSFSKVPREFLLPLANLLRRSGQFAGGLKALTPLMREQSLSHAEAAEYAVLLERCGAVEEALRVLQGVDTEQVPVARLYRAFCHFKSWDYALAIPELQTYAGTELSPYALLIANVNLAASFVVTGRHDEALRLLSANIACARELGFSRLHANCLELQAQVHFHHRDFKAARADLDQAALMLSGDETSDQWFITKWKKIISAFETSKVNGLTLWRADSMKRGDSESVREADLFYLQLKMEPARLRELYVGTPFAAYRARIRETLNCAAVVEDFRWGSTGGPVFDLGTGRIEDRDCNLPSLNAGKKNHQLVVALLRDTYRPLRVGGLFAALYPGEHFDIFTSPARVHQVIFRTRQWLESEKIPVRIAEAGQSYQLQIDGEFAFRIPAEKSSVAGPAAQLTLLKQTLDSQVAITSREARDILGVSPATAKRVLKWAVDQGQLQREGSKYKRAG